MNANEKQFLLVQQRNRLKESYASGNAEAADVIMGIIEFLTRYEIDNEPISPRDACFMLPGLFRYPKSEAERNYYEYFGSDIDELAQLQKGETLHHADYHVTLTGIIEQKEPHELLLDKVQVDYPTEDFKRLFEEYFVKQGKKQTIIDKTSYMSHTLCSFQPGDRVYLQVSFLFVRMKSGELLQWAVLSRNIGYKAKDGSTEVYKDRIGVPFGIRSHIMSPNLYRK